MVAAVGAEQVPVAACVVAVLAEALPGATVATRVPRRANGDLVFPERMVRVSRTGGPRLSVAHDAPTILVECWAADGVAAERLAGQARSVMLALDNRLVSDVSGAIAWLSHRSELSGVVDFDDDRTAHARFQFAHELLVRAAYGGGGRDG